MLTAATVSVLNTNTLHSIESFSESTENIKCEKQTKNWNAGDHVSSECLSYLSEEEQDEYTKTLLEDDLT